MRALSTIILFATAAIACSTPEPQQPVDAGYEGQHNPMVGLHVDRLVERYGQPDKVLEIGTDRSAYVYGLSVGANSDGRPCNDAYVVNARGQVIDYYCR